MIFHVGCFISTIFLIANPFILPSSKAMIICRGILVVITVNFLIFACHKGYGSIINKFLSSKYWIPLAKMALSIYLCSLYVQIVLQSFDIGTFMKYRAPLESYSVRYEVKMLIFIMFLAA